MKRTTVYCRSNGKDNLSFYIIHDTGTSFLFNQRFNYNVFQFYKNGVPLDMALDFRYGAELQCYAMKKVSEKLIPYIRFIEQDENVIILRKTRRAAERNMRAA